MKIVQINDFYFFKLIDKKQNQFILENESNYQLFLKDLITENIFIKDSLIILVDNNNVNLAKMVNFFIGKYRNDLKLINIDERHLFDHFKNIYLLDLIYDYKKFLLLKRKIKKKYNENIYGVFWLVDDKKFKKYINTKINKVNNYNEEMSQLIDIAIAVEEEKLKK